MTDKEMLNYAVSNGMINLDDIQQQIEVNERKKYLEMHDQKIWQGKDGRYRTYLKDDHGNRHLICKSKLKDLEDEIIKQYKEMDNEPTIYTLFYLWAEKKLGYGEIEKQTYDRYERDFNRFFGGSELLSRKVRYISEEDLEDFIKMSIFEKKLTTKAWSNLRTLLSGMFRFAKKNGYTKIVIQNFIAELDLSPRIFAKKVKKSEFDEVFTEEELSKLIPYLKNKPTLNNLGILLAAYTGMRVGEIVALKHEDIFEDYIFVNRTQIRYKDKNKKDVYKIRDYPKSHASIRKVVINESLKPIIKQIRMRSMGNEYLFVEKGKHKTIHALTMALYEACKKVGIDKKSMHKMRKTNATHLLNAGVPESVITNQLGHTDIVTTKKHYYFNDKVISQIKVDIDNAINF